MLDYDEAYGLAYRIRRAALAMSVSMNITVDRATGDIFRVIREIGLESYPYVKESTGELD